MARSFTINGTTLDKPPLNTDIDILDTSIYYRDVNATQQVAVGEVKEIYDISVWLKSSEITAIVSAISSNPVAVSSTGYNTNINDNFSIKNFKKSRQRVYISSVEYELCTFILEQE
jgi:hypothetical protein